MIEHVCQLPLKREYNIPFVTLERYTFKNVWKTWCSISKYAPKCSRYMDSMATVSAERKRYAASKYWWIIHPFSYLRFLWDTLMMAIYSIAFLTIPFMICFVVMDYESIRLDNVNIPIYAICWLDILVNCITGYYDKENTYIELKPTKILSSYLKGFLIPDMLSSLPYDRITLPWRRLPGNNPDHIVTLINMVPLLKLTRYHTLQLNIRHLFVHFDIKNFYYELCTTLLLGLYLTYWLACLCYLASVLVMHFGNLSSQEREDCWVTGLEAYGFAFRFKTALFMVSENILANGYGLFIPKTNSHIVLSSILMIIGRFIVCYMLIRFLRIKAVTKASESKYHEIINQLKAYTRQKQLLPHMKKRLLAYYHYRFKDSFFHEKQILADLSESLREEIALQSCRRLIDSMELFRKLPKDILNPIVKSLKFELYLPNDTIVKAGSLGDCMYFLSSGTVAILTPTGREVCHLDDGSHFGEIALLVADQRRLTSVLALEVCEVYRLDRKDFRYCVTPYSELLAKIERIATERVERTVRIEEQYKRFVMPSDYVQDYL